MPTTPASRSLTRRQDAAASSTHRPTHLRKRRSSSLHAHQRHTTLLFSLPSTLLPHPNTPLRILSPFRQKVWQNFYTIFNWSYSGLVFFRETLYVVNSTGHTAFISITTSGVFHINLRLRGRWVRVDVSTLMDELRLQPCIHWWHNTLMTQYVHWTTPRHQTFHHTFWLKILPKLWSHLKILGATRYRKASSVLKPHKRQTPRYTIQPHGDLAPRIRAPRPPPRTNLHDFPSGSCPPLDTWPHNIR